MTFSPAALRAFAIAVASVSLHANALTGTPTYTYDISGTNTDVWSTVYGYPYNIVSWNVVSGSALNPYPLDIAGGSGYRRFQDYPGNMMSNLAIARSADGLDSISETFGSYANQFSWPPGGEPLAYDSYANMFTGGSGRYAGLSGGSYSAPREVHFNQTTDPNGNIVLDSGTSSGSWQGYMSIPVATGASSESLPHTLTTTYRISGTEYSRFSDQPLDGGPGYTRTYEANFDASQGPVSWASMPFAVNSITEVVSDEGFDFFPRDVFSTLTTLAGPNGTLIGQHSGFRNVAGLHNFAPWIALDPKLAFETTGYEEFVTVFTEGTGAYAGAQGVILGWRQGLYQPGEDGALPFTVSYWEGYVSVPVPEPGSYALMAAGLVLLAGWSQRRRLS